MLLNIIVLLIIVSYNIFLALGREDPNKPTNYFIKKYILVEVLLLLLVVSLSINEVVDSVNYTDGFKIPVGVIDSIFIGFVVPPVISILGLFIKKIKRTSIISDLTFPNKLIPKTKKSFYLFVVFIVIGVIYEEIVMRYFLFHYFNKLFNLEGDWLILAGTLISSLSHLYLNTKGILLAVIVHLILSKIYLFTDSIIYTTLLHFLMDLNLIIELFALNFKRN